ncbi:dihydroorotase [Limnobacter humi]|uniref:Dihydroorotase n=1 Tax=Limnobacter humi TaxID=1778671 RepID=A0ABT1WKH6_9BURK|nr:dihydroorotase [Limnobacter humi]MCQ8897084.1 dihydroorotase [Limnobacter humi]
MASSIAPTTLTIAPPDDWHLHLRDGEALEHVVAATALNFRRAIVMPNLKPPVTTTEQALAYRGRILAAVDKACMSGRYSEADCAQMRQFQPLMVLYLTGATPADEIDRAMVSGAVHAVKLYPAGATTNSDAGVSDLLGQCSAVLARMQALGMPLLVHGEVTEAHVDVFDREAAFIESVMKPLRSRFPSLRVVFEHITTRQAAEYVTDHATRDAQGRLLLAATITPQHLLYNRNALFRGGLQPHWYCLPILKREEHRLALIKAATSGLPQFFLGTDSAPHARHLKEASCGCAGCYSAPYALGLYAEAFESVGALQTTDAFEAFTSRNGPAFYRLPVNPGRFELRRVPETVPERLPFVTDSGIVPLRAGETLTWSVTARE